MYKVTNISTTNLAMPNGSNLAPGQSTEVGVVHESLRRLQSFGGVSIVPMAPHIVIAAPVPKSNPKPTTVPIASSAVKLNKKKASTGGTL